MKSFPRSRAMGETVREVIARILVEQSADPRLHLVTVTGVDMSPDLRHANVYVTTTGDEARRREMLDGLDSAKGRIRTMLGQAIRMRYVPELHFRIDPAVDEAARISNALRAERESGRVRDDEPDDEPDGAGTEEGADA
jgi:ribosome-binding factor A